MRPISQSTVIQIEITNGCVLACANCTRHVGHHRKPFMMTLDEVRNAIESLDGFPGRIGLMGGEPAMHPQFLEILEIYREMIPDRRRREFWTTGWKWTQYMSAIMETFDEDRISYNDHVQFDGKHQPLLVAIDDVIADAGLKAELIDACWVQQKWSASITPKGAFFCEVAASLSHLFDGPRGWPVKPGWWERIPADYASQSDWACGKCSAAIPMPTYSDERGGRDGPTKDVISQSNLELLREAGSPKVARGHYVLWDREITPEQIDEYLKKWAPSNYRPFVAHTPEDVERETA